MVSVRSATWTVVLIELVLSTAMLIASLAVASAQAQSVNIDNIPQKPSLSVIATCIISFCLMASAIFAMFGLSGNQSGFLLPHIFFSIVVCIFHATLSTISLISWTEEISSIDGDWLIMFSGSLLFQACFLTAVYLEMRCYRRMT
uniref:NADH dehydrogenase subunit 6 n=1 Tax=Panagrolaimus sp. ES5 TaxID=591445 RepID=A0AC34GP79_9BILA